MSQTTLTAEKVQPEIQDCPANRDSRIQDTHIEWPGGKKFAFTIIDDTDLSTRQNTEPVYDFLAENGFRTTKTVWPLHSVGKKNCGGDTLEDAEYRDWILGLKDRDFEIALHGVSDTSSTRERIIEGLDRFREIIGNDPNIHINHVDNKEGLYWGSERLDPPVRWIYELFRGIKNSGSYEGAHRMAPHFWGDHCQQRIKYVRNLVFTDINTLKMDPLMPYHDPSRPYVRYWFSSSYGSSAEGFCRLISPENQDRLMQEGGACVVYTHLGSTFYPFTSDFKQLIRRLGALPGWFVPATELLDFVGSQRGWCNVRDHKLQYQRMQWNWLFQRILGEGVGKKLFSLRTRMGKEQKTIPGLESHWGHSIQRGFGDSTVNTMSSAEMRCNLFSASQRAHRVEPSTLNTIGVLSGLCLVGCITALFATRRWGIGVLADSTVYLGAARSLLSTGRLEDLDNVGRPVALVHFPPMVPCILAAISWVFRTPPIVSARYLNSLLLGLNIAALGAVTWRVLKSASLGIIAAVLALSFTPMLTFHLVALSEPVYLLFSIMALLFLHLYLEDPRSKWLVLSGIIGALALLTRHAGAALIISSTITLLFFPGGSSCGSRAGCEVWSFELPADGTLDVSKPFCFRGFAWRLSIRESSQDLAGYSLWDGHDIDLVLSCGEPQHCD